MNRGQDRVLLFRLGEQLRRYRLRCGQSQFHVAERIGLSQSTVSRMERGKAGGSPLRTWASVVDVLGLSIDLISSTHTEFPRADPMPRNPEDGRVAVLDLIVRLAATGHWVTQSRVVEGADGRVRSVGLTLRRVAPSQAVVVRVWDTVVDVEALLDDLEHELEAMRGSTDAEDINGFIVVRATALNRRQITQASAALDPRLRESGSRWIGLLRDPRPARLPAPAIVWADRAATRLIPGWLYLQRPRRRTG